MKTEKPNIWETYFYNEWEESEHEHWYFTTEEKAKKKYRELCKENWVKPSFCFTDKDWICVGYDKLHIED